MKKILLLLFFVATAVYAYTQVVVSNENFRYLYVGIENPISISIKDVPDFNTSVSVSTGEIKKVSEGRYSWKICNGVGSVEVIKIYNKLKIIDSIRFKLISLPDPKVIATTQDGEIIFKGIKAWWGIRAEINNTLIEGINCRIESFWVTIQKNNGAVVRLENAGQAYEKHLIDAFDNLVIGEKVTLSDFIVTVGCESTKRKLTTALSQVYSGKQYEFRH